MKTFNELSKEERSDALIRAKELLIGHIIEGVIEIKMPNNIVQETFEKILADMRKNENVKHARDMLIRHVTINRELDKISIAAAQGSRYDYNGYFLM